MEDELDLPQLALEVRYLWTVWQELHKQRPSAGFGPIPLTSKFIADYFKVYDQQALDVELSIILAIDQEYLSEYNKKQKLK